MSSIMKFVPEMLVKGDTSQLDNWIMGDGNSIYVKWVPNEISEEDARHYFGVLGTIKRVEFVSQRTGNFRMLFVHFEAWTNNWTSVDIRQKIAASYPNDYNMQITLKKRNYFLKCCINMRPIPTVDYNTHQLSDMFERLNTRVTQEMESMRNETKGMIEEMEKMVEEIKTLKANVERLNAVICDKKSDTSSNADEVVVYPEDEDWQFEQSKCSSEFDEEQFTVVVDKDKINFGILRNVHGCSGRHFV